ncbi:MAG: hypothetical protein ACOYJE_04775 [Bacteroidaceae bacterium]|jgi:hypothetical protein
MKKKQYVAPAIEVIRMELEGDILTGSDPKFRNKSGINLSLPDNSPKGEKSIWSGGL